MPLNGCPSNFTQDPSQMTTTYDLLDYTSVYGWVFSVALNQSISPSILHSLFAMHLAIPLHVELLHARQPGAPPPLTLVNCSQITIIQFNVIPGQKSRYRLSKVAVSSHYSGTLTPTVKLNSYSHTSLLHPLPDRHTGRSGYLVP